jgi:ParB family chromosome partitioning protein
MLSEKPAKPIAVPLEQDAYEVQLEHIEPDPNQPRKFFDEEELRDLAASIKENGMLQPIIVYRATGSGTYRIVAGERRFRAAQRAGLAAVPCLEMPPDFDRNLIDQLQLVENIQRADLRPIEAAEAIESYMARHKLSQRKAAEKLGKPLSFVAELLAIRKIPPALLARDGVARLPKQTLVEIGRAPASQQEQLIDQALAGLSLHQVKEKRTNRRPRERVMYFHETFAVEGQPPIEIRWKKHPEEVTGQELLEALGAVAAAIVDRSEFEHPRTHGMS